jgi:hypothetical protein
LSFRSSPDARHGLLRLEPGAALPDALVDAVGDGPAWVRATGVLEGVELRTGDGAPRRLAGVLQLVSADGVVDPSARRATLRGVLAREGDAGLEVLAGEIVAARAVAFEALVTVLEGAAPTFAASAPSAPAASWADAAAASAATDKSARANAPPKPIARRTSDTEDGLVPEAGDLVEHFAFGRAEVIRSEDDRLHIRVPKDGRVREIALEMLRVTALAPDGSRRRFKLERKM